MSVRQFYRVFVGNLPWTIGNNELRAFASSFGAVQQAVVVFDKSTGLSKGYGFVTFSTREAYNAATRRFPGNVTAKMFGFKQYPYFEVPKEAQAAPKVNFDKK